jgi:hypothetical protein
MTQRRRNQATVSKPLAPTVTSPAKMGESMAVAKSTASQSPNVKTVRKNNSKGGSPEAATANHRTGHQERLGAQWAPQMPLYEQNAASASETQRNVVPVRSAVGNRDFWEKRKYGQVQQ